MFNFFRVWAAFFRRDFLNLASYRLSFFMALVSLVFYLLIFFFVGRVFSGLGSAYLSRYGGAYFPFVVIGLAMQSLVGAGLGGLSQVISSEQYLGTLEPMLGRRGGAFRVLAAASLSRYITSSGRLIAYFVVSALVFGVSFRLGGFPLFAAVTALTVAAYFGLGMFSAAFLLAFKQGNPVNLFFGQLAALLSGVYFPVEVLPDWLRAVGAFIPLTYALEVGRSALLTGAAPAASAKALAILGSFAAVSLAVGAASFRWALVRAKRDGSLSQY
ncbi:MAG: ABC transporter permease [candidate division Zixibacteria bacterium]|nr:ABC transporter permease [candidate division Zixibacteria bacterium]